MSDSIEVRRSYSGHPMFDKFVGRGADPDAFNRAYAHFTANNPRADFAEAVASLAAEASPARKMARAVELFGRTAREIVAFSD